MEFPAYTHESLKNMRLNDLRDILKKLNLFSTGNKDVLIQRILESSKVSELNFNHADIITSDCSYGCICISGTGPTVVCSRCNNLQHRNCIGTNLDIQPYECTQCQMDQMEPLDKPIKFLVGPRVLNRGSFTQTISEFVVDYNDELLRRVVESYGKLQIHVRCLKLDNVGYTQSWPKTGCLRVNARNANEFRQNPNPNAKKRKDSPCNITHLLQKGPNSINLVKSNDDLDYVVAVVLVQLLEEDALISEIETRNIQSIDASKDYIRGIMKSDTEEIISESQSVSLRCPYAMNLLTKPARGMKCRHIQCFNLDSYIKLQRSSRANRWKCPICKEFAFNLYVDKFMQKIGNEAQEIEDPYAVEIDRNSTYRIIPLDEKISQDISYKLPKTLTTPKRPRDSLALQYDILTKKCRISEDKKENVVPNLNETAFKPKHLNSSNDPVIREISESVIEVQEIPQPQNGSSDCPILID